MSDFKIFYVVLPNISTEVLPGRFAREKDASALAEAHTKKTGVECFVMKAGCVFFTKPDSDSLYHDWDEINRLDDADTKKALGEIAPAPPEPAPVVMDRDSARALTDAGMMETRDYVEKFGEK